MAPRLLDWHRPLGPVLLAVVTVALIAAFWPVRGTGGNARPNAVVEAPPAQIEPASEDDLTAFMASRRWGVPLEEILAAEAADAAAAAAAAAAANEESTLNPALLAIGFLGLSRVDGQYTVLLGLPKGEVVRLGRGDALPDGRILAAVTANAITLDSATGDSASREVLTLFTRAPPDVAPALPNSTE